MLAAAIQQTGELRATLQTSLEATIQHEVNDRVLLGKAVTTNTATIDAVLACNELGLLFSSKADKCIAPAYSVPIDGAVCNTDAKGSMRYYKGQRLEVQISSCLAVLTLTEAQRRFF